MEYFLNRRAFHGTPSLIGLEETTLLMSTSEYEPKFESRFGSKNPLDPTTGRPDNLYNFSYC